VAAGVVVTTRTFAVADLDEEEFREVKVERWRHGVRVTYVFPHEDAHWMVTICEHPTEGWQAGDYVEALKVREQESTVVVKEWVATP
jgi:hypothetical protein